MLIRRRALVVRLGVRILVLAGMASTLSFVPIAQTASARLERQGIVLEAGSAAAGFHEVVDLDLGAEMVGFTWSGANAATIEVRGLQASGWTEWVSLDGAADEGPDRRSREHRVQVSAGPTWLGKNITSIETRVISGVAPGLTLHAIDTEPAAAPRFGVKPAGAETPIPAIRTRAQWGADESLRSEGPTYASRVKFAVVHHSVNSNSYGPGDSAALIRGMYLFHTQANGWSDIGYNFLVDRYGQVFEGRYGGINQAVMGAHAGGFNAGSTGIALIGDFSSSGVPSPAYQALRGLLAWKLAYHQIDPRGTTTHTVAESDCNCQNFPVGSTVTIPTVGGHRDLDQTSCPGTFLYDLLPQLRNDVAMDIGNQGPAEWACQWDVDGDFGPGAVSPLSGRTDVYVRGGDGQLWQKVQLAGGSSPWSPLGGFLSSDPDAASRSPGSMDVVVRGGDQAVWIRTYNGAVWLPWQSLGGRLASSPSVVSWGPGHLAVFGCGMDGALWTRTFDGAWGPWQSLGGILFAAPDASSDGVNRLDVVVRGAGGAMYRRAFRGGGWSGWEGVGGAMTSGGGTDSWGANRIDVAMRGLDGQLWANAWTGSSWFGWYTLGGVITSDPDVASASLNTLTITARGQDGNYWQRAFDGSRWLPWRVV